MKNDRFLRACRRQEVDRTPIWLMRQAGRYMPEFRALRAEHDFLTRVKTPELAAAITMQPINAFDLDAAIVFADIIPPLEGMGLQISFAPGPTIHNPVRSAADIAALRVPDPRETVAYSIEAVRLVKRELADTLPLIGFSGAPFTLASYAIEGGGSRDFARTRALMYEQPDAWHQLMAKLTTLVGEYLVAQSEAGADALQIFDSWAGILSPFDYAEYVLPYVKQCIATVQQGTQKSVASTSVVSTNANTAPSNANTAQVMGTGGASVPTTDYTLPTTPPIIYFGTDMGGLHALLRTLDADVLGADWRVNLDEAWAQLGPGFAIQGNLDPHALLAPWPVVERRAADILDRAAGRPGHIFNLGHGILPETPVENVRRLVDFVHSYSG